MKDGSGNQTSEQVVDDSARFLKPKVSRELIGGDQNGRYENEEKGGLPEGGTPGLVRLIELHVVAPKGSSVTEDGNLRAMQRRLCPLSEIGGGMLRARNKGTVGGAEIQF